MKLVFFNKQDKPFEVKPIAYDCNVVDVDALEKHRISEQTEVQKHYITESELTERRRIERFDPSWRFGVIMVICVTLMFLGSVASCTFVHT